MIFSTYTDLYICSLLTLNYIYVYVCVCTCVSLCAPCEWKCLQKPESVGVSGTKVTGRFKSPDMGAGNWTQALCVAVCTLNYRAVSGELCVCLYMYPYEHIHTCMCQAIIPGENKGTCHFVSIKEADQLRCWVNLRQPSFPLIWRFVALWYWLWGQRSLKISYLIRKFMRVCQSCCLCLKDKHMRDREGHNPTPATLS